MALAQDGRTREQASRERTGFSSTRAQIVERVEAALDTRDRNPELAIGQIVRNDGVVPDGVASPDLAECGSTKLSHGLSFLRIFQYG